MSRPTAEQGEPMSERRISVEEVLAAYKATGLKPIRFRTIGMDGNCGCAIAALAISEGSQRTKLACEYWANTNLGQLYRLGFMDGFDGISLGQERPGYLDGCAAAAAVFGEGVK